jgi:gluconolactonase
MTDRTALLVALLSLPLNGAALLAQDESSIRAPGAKLEQLFSGGIWLEGPAVAPDGSVYFSDITYTDRSGGQAGHILRYDPRTGATTVFRSPSGMANGIAFDARGDMIVAEGADFGGRRITRTDMQTGRSYIVAGLFAGRRFNSPNDLAIDGRGRIYFTDPRYVGSEPIEQPVMGVYRVDPDGRVSLLAANLWKPNGVAVAPDQRTLYVVEVGDYSTGSVEATVVVGGPPSAIHAYDLLDDGAVRYRDTVVTLAPGTWGDGLTVDADGNLYLGVGGPPGSTGVHVYAPDGRRLAVLPTPETAVNLEFGRGDDANVLYVACSRSPSGSGIWTPPPGNGLYRIRLERRGFHVGAP